MIILNLPVYAQFPSHVLFELSYLLLYWLVWARNFRTAALRLQGLQRWQVEIVEASLLTNTMVMGSMYLQYTHGTSKPQHDISPIIPI